MDKKIEQLREFFKSNGITQEKAAEKLGVTVGAVNVLLKGRRNFGKKSANDWAAAFGLNPHWLIYGDGEMMKNAQTVDEASVAAPTVYFAPLVSKYAYAGITAGWGDDEYLATLPKYPMFVDHDPRGQYYAFEVKGDSMDDGTDRSIKEGSICLCRYISPDLYKDAELHLRRWLFVVVTTDGILIKKIKEHNTFARTITISSFNPAYPDQQISLGNIKALLNVVQVTHTPTL